MKYTIRITLILSFLGVIGCSGLNTLYWYGQEMSAQEKYMKRETKRFNKIYDLVKANKVEEGISEKEVLS